MIDFLDHLSIWVDDFDPKMSLAKLAFSARKRSRLYRKIASLSRTGMPLPKALDAIWQLASVGGKKPESALALAVGAWRSKVYDGHSFGEALREWAPAREWMIVEAGASDLGLALDEAALLIDSGQRVKGAVLAATGYPLFLSVLLCVLLWIFSVDAVPAFAEVKPMDQWTGLAASMATLSTVVRTALVPVAGVLTAAVAAALWSLPAWTGSWRCRVEALPPWSFYRLVMGTSFLTSLGAFLRAGMPVPEALRRLAMAANPWLKERIDAALYYVNSGHDLGEALHLSEYGFPAAEIIEDLRIYATLGSLDEALPLLSSEWVKQSLENLQMMGNSARVGGMAAVAVTIAWVQIGILAVQQQLTGGM